MEFLREAIGWYRLNRGVGKRMRDDGAQPMPCPHCARETPVFRSSYDATGDPTSFSVCCWCRGLIEYGGSSSRPHAPYATAKEIQAEGRRSKP